ncbi:MAG: paraquat-inducible protein A, partial [Desulfobacterales bacterium]|nr:paraquat-inducible protein A [Desulfobacterales bacterium]
LMVVLAAAHASLDPEEVWARMEPERNETVDLPGGSGHFIHPGAEGPTAAQLGLISCHTCGKLLQDTGDHGQACDRCQRPVHSRTGASLQQTWALLISAVILFIPANLYPAMTMHQLGQKGVSSTILGGVVFLIEQGSSGLALIIFFASIMVPALKLVILSGLLISVQQGWKWRPRDRTFLYRVTEVIGAWSMVDVYVVAVLVGLVNLGLLADVRAEVGMSFFGAVVVMTMMAAMRFDPRLIWDNLERQT